MRTRPTFTVSIFYEGFTVRKYAWKLSLAIAIAEKAPAESGDIRPDRAVIMRYGVVPEVAFSWDSDDVATAKWCRNLCL